MGSNKNTNVLCPAIDSWCFLLQYSAKPTHMSWLESRAHTHIHTCIHAHTLTPTRCVFLMVVHASHPYTYWLSCWKRILCQSQARCTTDTDIMRILYCALSSRPSPFIRLNVIARKWYAVGSFRTNTEPWGSNRFVRHIQFILDWESKIEHVSSVVMPIVSFTIMMSFKIYRHQHYFLPSLKAYNFSENELFKGNRNKPEIKWLPIRADQRNKAIHSNVGKYANRECNAIIFHSLLLFVYTHRT